MPYVAPAAPNPIANWRRPERDVERDVKRVIAAPIANSAKALALMLSGTALFAGSKANPVTGRSRRPRTAKDDDAAVQADPPSSLGSMFSSSRAMTASARS
jgi:hypothetical protein